MHINLLYNILMLHFKSPVYRISIAKLFSRIFSHQANMVDNKQ